MMSLKHVRSMMYSNSISAHPSVESQLWFAGHGGQTLGDDESSLHILEEKGG
jgi:hypothetical protein